MILVLRNALRNWYLMGSHLVSMMFLLEERETYLTMWLCEMFLVNQTRPRFLTSGQSPASRDMKLAMMRRQVLISF